VNRIYRLIWSRVTNRWVAVSETTRRRGKSGRRAVLARKALVTALSLACAPFAHAGQAVDVRQPEVAAHAGRPCIPPGCESTAAASSTQPVGGQVVSGVASIAQSGEITTIRQSSQDLVLNWQSFNIGAQETVDFLQPSAAAIAVNRILGTNGTQILGHLDANGQVWLINPNGVLFEQGAQVNVGGLVASVLGVSDLSLSSNAIRFNGDGTGASSIKARLMPRMVVMSHSLPITLATRERLPPSSAPWRSARALRRLSPSVAIPWSRCRWIRAR